MNRGKLERIPNPDAKKGTFKDYYATKLLVDGKIRHALFTGHEIADLEAVQDNEDAESRLGVVSCTVTLNLPLPTSSSTPVDYTNEWKLWMPVSVLVKALERAEKHKSLITRIGLCQ